jgi:hypothetical protein
VLSGGRVVAHLTGADRTEENVIACATTGRRMFPADERSAVTEGAPA